MEDENTCFPMNGAGYWHNGAHITDEKNVIQKYPAFIRAVRNGDVLPDDSKELYEMITEAEYGLLSGEEKAMYTGGDNGIYYILKKPSEKSVIKKILKALRLYSSPDFVLFQHNLYSDRNAEKLKFFSLYMHLNEILDEKCTGEIKYYNRDDFKAVFPGTVFAASGVSEKDGVIYQGEYFMNRKNADRFFQGQSVFSGNEYYEVKGEVQLFSMKGVNETAERKYLRNTVFEIREFPDEEKYPDIAKVRPYLLPCSIYKDSNIKSADIDLKFKLKTLIQVNLLELKVKEKIQYLLDNEFINRQSLKI